MVTGGRKWTLGASVGGFLGLEKAVAFGLDIVNHAGLPRVAGPALSARVEAK
jgi:hypothetical protein